MKCSQIQYDVSTRNQNHATLQNLLHGTALSDGWVCIHHENITDFLSAKSYHFLKILLLFYEVNKTDCNHIVHR